MFYQDRTCIVSFFGHRIIYDVDLIEDRLIYYIDKMLKDHTYVEFLLGRDGEFDILTASCIRRRKRYAEMTDSELVWVLPYAKAEYYNNADEFDDYYDSVEICNESSRAHYKAAIQIRNRCMVDRSDIVIVYVTEKSGGAYMTMKYAMRQGKTVINIADELKK